MSDETSSSCAEEHSKYYETLEEFDVVLTFHSFESLHFCFLPQQQTMRG